MADNSVPARRRRRRGSKSTQGSDPDARSALEASSSTPPRSGDALEDSGAGLASSAPEGADDALPESAVGIPPQGRPEMPTSEEEEEVAAHDDDVISSLLPPKRVAAARKTKRDNTQPLSATALHVHVIGQIDKGVGFPSGAFVNWTLLTGDRWELVAGQDGGQTFQDST